MKGAAYVRLVFLVTIVLCYKVSNAQSRKGTILTEQDTTLINLSARNTIKSFFETIYFVTATGFNADDKKIFVEKSVTTDDKIFVDRKSAQIEDDHSPGATSSNGSTLSIEDYLNTLMTTCKSDENNNQYTITWISCIKKISGRLLVKIRYNQEFRMSYIDSASLKFSKVAREAILVVQHDENNGWKTYISNISFFDTSAIAGDYENCVTISNILEGNAKSGNYFRKRDKEECAYLFKKGKDYLETKKWADAFYCLKIAGRFPDYTQRCKDIIRQKLYPAIVRGGFENPDNFLSDQLQKKASELEDAYRLKEALSFLYMSYSLTPINLALGNRIEVLEEKLAVINQAEQLYKNGFYQNAADKYKSLLGEQQNKKNPFLFIGLANCYHKLKNEKDAEILFLAAEAIDPNSDYVYSQAAKYYLSIPRPDYQVACESYLKAAILIADSTDPVYAETKSNFYLAKGIQEFANRNYNKAIDFFNMALKMDDMNSAAFVMSGRSYCELNNIEKAISALDSAISIDENFGEAYYYRGIAYHKGVQSMKRSYFEDQSLADFRKAVNIERNNSLWNLELGRALMNNVSVEQGSESSLDEAIGCFNICISEDSLCRQQALIDRGECYYIKGDYANAKRDFELVDTSLLSDKLFYNDLGLLSLKVNDLSKAKYYFAKNINTSSLAMYGMGEITYVNNTATDASDDYQIWFRKAFYSGISHYLVMNDPMITMITNKDKKFKKMKASLGY